MINIQDLKIGNILQRIDMQGDLSPCVVMQIGKKSFGVLQDGLNHGILDLKECSHIPLTEQILLDSGFEKADYRHNTYVIACGEKTFLVSFGTEISFETVSKTFIHREIPCHSTVFVHDLQNAYYQATGENLKIAIK